jgi:hypothetical protein
MEVVALTTLVLETPYSPQECKEQLGSLFGGRMRVPGLSISRAASERRVIGRIESDRVTMAMIDPAPTRLRRLPPLLQTLFSLRMATAVVDIGITGQAGGSLLRSSAHPPVGDVIAVASGMAVIFSLIRLGALYLVSVVPLSLLLYVLLPAVRRDQFNRDASDLVRLASKTLEATPTKIRLGSTR